MLGQRLTQLRQERGLTKKEMAKELDMAYSTYLNYENDVNRPNNEVLVKLAKHFGVSADYLLGVEQKPPANAPLYVDDETREIIDTLRKRPEMRILFSVSQNVSKEDIEATVEILKRFKQESEK